MESKTLTLEEIDAIELPAEPSYYPFDARGYDAGKDRAYDLRELPRWCRDIFKRWFFMGLEGNIHEDRELHLKRSVYNGPDRTFVITPKQGTLNENLRRISPLMGSYEPSQQQKEATCALYFYRLFDCKEL